jgi:hypothetical protein
MYKVNYQTFGILPDGTEGNVVQSQGVLYTDHDISGIQRALNDLLAVRRRFSKIMTIEWRDGIVIAKGGE